MALALHPKTEERLVVSRPLLVTRFNDATGNPLCQPIEWDTAGITNDDHGLTLCLGSSSDHLGESLSIKKPRYIRRFEGSKDRRILLTTQSQFGAAATSHRADHDCIGATLEVTTLSEEAIPTHGAYQGDSCIFHMHSIARSVLDQVAV